MHHAFPLLRHNHNHQSRCPHRGAAGGQSLLLAGHNDDLKEPRVTRADVAEVLLQAILRPELSKWTRFDLSSDSSKPATGDFEALFETARNWRGPADATEATAGKAVA